MLIKIGEKLHVIYRALYENSTRQHFVGEVTSYENGLARLDGYVFVHEVKKDGFLRKEDTRTTFVNVGENGYIINVIPQQTNLVDILYKYVTPAGMVVTDDKDFRLDISEFTFKT